METVESLRGELESCVSHITSSGLASLDPADIEKLEQCSAAAAALGMGQGKKLVDNLSTVLKSFKEGAAKEDSVQIRLTAMDFYLKNIQSGTTEEL
jgi:hypothetical protein